MRLIAVGDIHGHLDKLNSVLDQVQPTTDDQLVFLGDYIDRGPDSPGVINRLIQLQKNFPQTMFLRGNHDQMLLDCLYWRGLLSEWSPLSSQTMDNRFENDPLRHERNYLYNGGSATHAQYIDWNLIPADHIKFLMATRLTFRADPFLFVHAGAMPELEAEQQDPFILLWSRVSPPGKNGEIHVVGHTPNEWGEPLFEAGRINLDTGAGTGFNGPLTACDVLTRQIWQSQPVDIHS